MNLLKISELYKFIDVYLFKSFVEITKLDLYETTCICLILGYKEEPDNNFYHSINTFYKVLYKNSIYYVSSKNIKVSKV